jgi:hypothetical protein
MKPKEWLKANGHIDTIGRGRLSAAHIALITEAVANGAKIEGYSVSSVKATDESVAAKPAVERVKTDANRLLDVPDALRSDKDYTLVRKDTGKPIHAVGMRNVCQGCGSSFTYCPCRVPTFLDNTGTVAVEFRMKKGG